MIGREKKAPRESIQSRGHSVISLLFLFVLLCTPFVSFAEEGALADAPETKCASILLYDFHTGTILYDKNAQAQRTPASITKIMTCVIALETLDMEQEITVPKEAVLPQGSNMDLKEGEVLTVEQLINATLICSANDGALALAIAVAGSEDAFIDLMNQRAQELGMANTNYISVNGFTESFDHTTTCYDLKKLVDYALTVPGFREITKKQKYEIPATNKSDKRTIKTTNRLLNGKKHMIEVNGQERPAYYEGAFGIKTGMMLSSMYCLVAGAKQGDTELICICLYGVDEDDRYCDSIALFDSAFGSFRSLLIKEAGETCGQVKVKYGKETKADAVAKEEIWTLLEEPVVVDDAESEGMVSYQLYEDVEAPLKKGAVVGKATVDLPDGSQKETDLILTKSIDKGGPWTALYISDRTFYSGLAIFILVIVLVLVLRTNKKARQKRRAKKAAARRG